MATSPTSSSAVQRAAMASATSPRNAQRNSPPLSFKSSPPALNPTVSSLKPQRISKKKSTPRSGTAVAIKMLRKYVKKFGKLPERPEHLVAFGDKHGGVRFVDARAAMRATGIDTLEDDDGGEAEAAALAEEQRKAAAKEAAEQAARERQAAMLQEDPTELTANKVALRRWLSKHGFKSGDGLEVLDAVDIREIADFEFVEVRDLVDGGMPEAVANRLLSAFAEFGTSVPPEAAMPEPQAQAAPHASPTRAGGRSPRISLNLNLSPRSKSRSRSPKSPRFSKPTSLPQPLGADTTTGVVAAPAGSDFDQGIATPLLTAAARSRSSVEQSPELPAPTTGDDDSGQGADEFQDDFDSDDDDKENAAHAAQEVAALPSIASPVVRKAVSNSARRQARWEARVEAFLQEHDPELLNQDGYVDGLLAEYRGREVALLRKLRDDYSKPKPSPAPAPAPVAENDGDDNGSFGSSFGSDWGSDDEDMDAVILQQFMDRLRTTLSGEYGQHVLRIEAAVSNAKYDNDLQRIVVRRSSPTDSLGCMVSTNRVAWRNHVFLEVTQIRYTDEERRVPGPAMAAGLQIGDIIVSILGDEHVNSLDHFKELCRDKTEIEMTVVRPLRQDLSHITQKELAAVQKVIEARVQVQQREILKDARVNDDYDDDEEEEESYEEEESAPQHRGHGQRHSDMSPNTRHQRQQFAHDNQPRVRKPNVTPDKVAGGTNQDKGSPVSPKRIRNPSVAFSRVGLPPLTSCRPFEPVDPKRGLVWFRMERSNNGKKFSLIDTKVEESLLIAEQKKILQFDYEIRYGLGMRQLYMDEGGMNPTLGIVKMVDVSKLRYICRDVREDASRPVATNDEIGFIRYKIISDRKFVTLVIPKTKEQHVDYQQQQGPKIARKISNSLSLHEAFRTHRKDLILTFENEPPEFDQSLGHHVAPTTAPRKVSEAFIASVKNFVLWSADGPVMEFWRTGKDTYAVAVGHPLTLVQAFTTAISSVNAPS